MSPRSAFLDSGLYRYVLEHGLREHEALKQLRLETSKLADGNMQSSPEQMQLIALILQTMSAKRVLEIGCFTGYGALSMALALPEDGKLITLDVNDDWASIGKRFWRLAGVEDKIELRLGLAIESLEALPEDEPFDFVYIDADKKSYGRYLDHALRLVRIGGMIALDNVFWGGSVADPNDQSKQATTLREVTARIHQHPDLSPCMVPIGDGLMLARRIR